MDITPRTTHLICAFINTPKHLEMQKKRTHINK